MITGIGVAVLLCVIAFGLNYFAGRKQDRLAKLPEAERSAEQAKGMAQMKDDVARSTRALWAFVAFFAVLAIIGLFIGK